MDGAEAFGGSEKHEHEKLGEKKSSFSVQSWHVRCLLFIWVELAFSLSAVVDINEIDVMMVHSLLTWNSFIVP